MAIRIVVGYSPVYLFVPSIYRLGATDWPQKVF